jgi:hypothetical protein
LEVFTKKIGKILPFVVVAFVVVVAIAKKIQFLIFKKFKKSWLNLLVGVAGDKKTRN